MMQGFAAQVRALCTYHGQGTQFVANRFADRRPLQRMLFSDTGGYGLKVPDALEQASAGDLLYLKGHNFPGNAGWLARPAFSVNTPAHVGLHAATAMGCNLLSAPCCCRWRSGAQIAASKPKGETAGIDSGRGSGT